MSSYILEYKYKNFSKGSTYKSMHIFYFTKYNQITFNRKSLFPSISPKLDRYYYWVKIVYVCVYIYIYNYIYN